jgi:dTMP kinase
VIIALEGVDASGKATHSRLLAEHLGAGGFFSFPNYNSPTGKLIKEHLQGEWAAVRSASIYFDVSVSRLDNAAEDALVFQALMTVNRMEVAEAINRADALGDVVLDRYWPSGYVYGTLDGLSPEYLIEIHKILPQPDLFLLLDVDVGDSLRRRPDRRDRYEKDDKMHRRVDLYRELWAKPPPTYSFEHGEATWKVINARGTKAEVQESIRRAVSAVRGR